MEVRVVGPLSRRIASMAQLAMGQHDGAAGISPSWVTEGSRVIPHEHCRYIRRSNDWGRSCASHS
jgi:hypothetical protein